MTTITAAQLHQFAPQCKDPASWATALATAAARFAINTRLRVCHWMAQMGEESGGFTVFAENLYYTTPERIAAVYPRDFIDATDAIPYCRNPEKLANRVYANMYGNGDEDSGDGFRYRGQGPIQETFKSAFADAEAALNRPYVAHPELVQQPTDGALTAAWLFAVYKHCLPAADRNDIVGVTRPLQPSLGAMAQREAQLVAAMKVWTV